MHDFSSGCRHVALGLIDKLMYNCIGENYGEKFMGIVGANVIAVHYLPY
jgi:hypothetical protein